MEKKSMVKRLLSGLCLLGSIGTATSPQLVCAAGPKAGTVAMKPTDKQNKKNDKKGGRPVGMTVVAKRLSGKGLVDDGRAEDLPLADASKLATRLAESKVELATSRFKVARVDEKEKTSPTLTDTGNEVQQSLQEICRNSITVEKTKDESGFFWKEAAKCTVYVNNPVLDSMITIFRGLMEKPDLTVKEPEVLTTHLQTWEEQLVPFLQNREKAALAMQNVCDTLLMEPKLKESILQEKDKYVNRAIALIDGRLKVVEKLSNDDVAEKFATIAKNWLLEYRNSFVGLLSTKQA